MIPWAPSGLFIGEASEPIAQPSTNGHQSLEAEAVAVIAEVRSETAVAEAPCSWLQASRQSFYLSIAAAGRSGAVAVKTICSIAIPVATKAVVVRVPVGGVFTSCRIGECRPRSPVIILCTCRINCNE